MKRFIQFIEIRPWILVVLAFVVLISVWVTFYILAAANQPVRLLVISY